MIKGNIDSTAIIDPTSIVDPTAEIAANVFIAPGCIVGANCVIGEGTQLNPYVVIKSNTSIGKSNKVYSFAVIGEDPQVLNTKEFSRGDTFLEIGDNNVIREFASIHRGTLSTDFKTTKIGNGCLIMSHSHVGHDCQIGDNVVVSSHAVLGGHISVANNANIGGNTAVHQFCNIGEYAMVGGQSGIMHDVLPYTTVFGIPARTIGLNSRGLRRSGIGTESRSGIKHAYKLLFRSGLSIECAMEQIKQLPTSDEIDRFIVSIEGSKRGFTKGDNLNDRSDE